jgi:uncharacterized protein YggT (Ycf19 family)
MQPIPSNTPTPSAERGDVKWSAEPVQPTDAGAPVQQAPFVTPPTSRYSVDTPAERRPAGSATARAAQIVYLILGLGEALMIARVALKLLAANANVGFVRFIYGVSAPLVAPFQGIFATPTSQGNVLELSSLVAIVVYAVIAWALVRVVLIIGRQGGLPAPH